MAMLLDIALIVVSIGFLWKGSDMLVESAAKIAASLGISDLVIGLTVVAIGTSAPEFAVTISAVLAGKSDISVSNVVGSNIFNLGFILGGTAMIHEIHTTKKVVNRDGTFLILITLLLSYFLFNPVLENFSLEQAERKFELVRWEGAVLFSLLVIYMSYLFFKKEVMDDEEIDHSPPKAKDWFFLLLGIGGVVYGGHLLVESASNVARAFGVSDWVIGVTIVAAGTSAPEMATSITAAIKGKHGMAIGNLIGSDMFNLLGVLGLAGMLKETLVVSPAAQSSMIMLVVMVCVVVFFMRSDMKVSRTEGAILVGVNLVRWVYDFMGNSAG